MFSTGCKINRRFEYNFALEYAVAWANKLDKPLLIYEGLNIDYPWASDRMHAFLMQGMQENQRIAKDRGLNFFSYVEPKSEAGKGLFYTLAENACCVISDEFPVLLSESTMNGLPIELMFLLPLLILMV